MPESASIESAAIVRFENVGLRYGLGPEVLRDISLTMEPGSFHFLTGASGAGKSSLLRLMYLAQRPTRGILSVFGRNVASVSRNELAVMRRQVGFVFQDFRLLDNLSAVENVALPLHLAGADLDKASQEVVELLTWVGLGEHLNARPATMSGGQKQRLAIARAVITRPRLLLADEPTGNVDDQIALRLLFLFEELHKMGTTVVIATHNESLVTRFGHPELRLENGRVTQARGSAG
jgi:cell division transport system ATP-binding protein